MQKKEQIKKKKSALAESYPASTEKTFDHNLAFLQLLPS